VLLSRLCLQIRSNVPLKINNTESIQQNYFWWTVLCDVSQWRSQDLEVGGTESLRDGSPPAESRGRAPGVGLGAKPPPPESSQHITDIWLPNHARFCEFSRIAWAAGKAREKSRLFCVFVCLAAVKLTMANSLLLGLKAKIKSTQGAQKSRNFVNLI